MPSGSSRAPEPSPARRTSTTSLARPFLSPRRDIATTSPCVSPAAPDLEPAHRCRVAALPRLTLARRLTLQLAPWPRTLTVPRRALPVVAPTLCQAPARTDSF